MKALLQRMVGVLGRVNGPLSLAGRNVAGALLAVMLALALAQIISRGLFHYSLDWAEELARVALVWSVLLVAPFAYRKGAHVAIISFAETLPPRLLAATSLVLNVLIVWILAVLFFAALQLTDASSADDAAAGISPALVAREALQAIQQCDLVRLQRLAERMTESAPTEQQAARDQPPEKRAQRCPVDLAAPFPAAAVQHARDLGFGLFELPGPRRHLQSLVDFMYRHARQPIFHPGTDHHHERVMQLHAVVQSTEASASTAEVFREFVELFIHHSYVNSAGARYLPPVVPEVVLVEDFPETAEPPSAGPCFRKLGLAGNS